LLGFVVQFQKSHVGCVQSDVCVPPPQFPSFTHDVPPHDCGGVHPLFVLHVPRHPSDCPHVLPAHVGAQH
jgi:hypothetical protein